MEFSGWTKLLIALGKLQIFFIGEIYGPTREQHPADVMEVMIN